MATSDGGRTWHAASAAVQHAGHAWGLATRSADGQTIVSGDTGVETGYLQNVTVGPWTSTSRWTWTAPAAGGDMAGAGDHTRGHQSAIGPLPHPTGLLFWEGGGISPLDDSGLNFIATPQVWYSNDPITPNAGFTCCNGSIAAFVTHNAGDTWTYVSDVATKASVEAAGWKTEEGPNENDVVLMGDGKTIMVVFRIDGGDGAPKPSPHVPYLFAKSTDQGATWKYEQAPPSMLAARPRALCRRLPGPMCGGRPMRRMVMEARRHLQPQVRRSRRGGGARGRERRQAVRSLDWLSKPSDGRRGQWPRASSGRASATPSNSPRAPPRRWRGDGAPPSGGELHHPT